MLEWAERWIALGQSPEPAYRALMVAYSALGDMSKVASVFERCVASLRDDLGVEPSEQTRALYEQLSKGKGLPGIAPPSPLTRQRTTNLPVPLTSFVGRKREIAEIKQLLSTARLLTLTGAGGSGKTRLAIQVATDLVRQYEDGAWWVELAALTDAALVLQTVARALGVHELPDQPLVETLANALRSRRLLLVLDNCEHLVHACAQLAEELLSACPHLQILTTSREALNILGETTWTVPPLSLPEPHHVLPLQDLKAYEGIQLFVERASAVKPGFTLTEQNALAIAQICRRLDGIPLAIELATDRLKVLSVEEIAARLDDRFSLLTAGSRTALPRHQTLQATIDWSYDLLTEPEQRLFRQLSVFAGGFTLRAAEAVADDEWHILDLLTHLVDKSLLIVEERQGESRYRLLETIREYAREKLAEAGEVEMVRNRHLWWLSHGHYHEALERFRQMLSQPGALKRTLARANALIAAGFIYWALGNEAVARPLLEEALAIGRELGDELSIARALLYLGAVAYSQGDHTAARSLIETGLMAWRKLGSAGKHGVAWSLAKLGDSALYQRDYERARKLCQESVALLEEFGDKNLLAYPLRRLGQVALHQRDYGEAVARFKKSLTLKLDVGHKQGVAPCLAGFAGIATVRGQPIQAARLLGTVEAILNAIAIPLWPVDRIEYEHYITVTRAQLDEATFMAAWAEGQALTLEQAVSYALEEARE